MRRLICLVVLLGIFGVAPVLAAEEISVLCNGEKIVFDVPPVMEDDRVLVPFRKIFEAMGAEVTWEDPVATAMLDGNTIEVTLDRYVMQKNGVYIFLDVPARLRGDRTMVPVRAVAEGLGAEVSWQDETQTVVISMQTAGNKEEFPAYTEFPEVPDFAEMTEGAQLISSVAYGGGLRYRVPDAEKALSLYDKSLRQLGFAAKQQAAYMCYQKNDVEVLTGTYPDGILLVLQRKKELSKPVYYEKYPGTPDFGACFSVPVLEETENSVSYSMFSIELSDLDGYMRMLSGEGFLCTMSEDGCIYCTKPGIMMSLSYTRSRLCIQWLS